MILNVDDYRRKVLGCWLGKNIGGTLGGPMEWKRQVNDVSFYTRDLGGEPLPNDDLDIQLLWLIALEEQGIDVDAHLLSEYWCIYVTPHWAEYGIAKANLRLGLPPPMSGTVNNDYRDSCGAFIRSEIWACIAPGLPRVAAHYAYQDAIIDHGNGEGTYAEVFCAALESAAFVLDDIRELIDIGLSYIPADCAVANAVRCAISCADRNLDWRAGREEILRHYRGASHGGNPENTSPEDREKGFHEGKLGFDVPSNIAIVVLGLLLGGDDFDRMICTTVNCGEDTDCTGATAGSIYGLIHGADAIPQKWIEPIGRSIQTACLNLGELGHFGDRIPQTVDELTERTECIARQVLLRHRQEGVALAADAPTAASSHDLAALKCDDVAPLYRGIHGITCENAFFRVDVDLDGDPFIRSGEQRLLRVSVRNRYRVQANVSLHWYLPPGWSVKPSASGVVQALPGRFRDATVMQFTLCTDQVERALNRCVLELTVEGRPTVLTVPVMLMNGDFKLVSQS